MAWDRQAVIRLLDEIKPIAAFLRLDGAEARSSPAKNADGIMRFERLAQDFHVVCERLGLPQTELPVRNKSARAHFSSYYDAELIELVRRRFEDDIAEFGYDFERRP